jgi:hypothetical protein
MRFATILVYIFFISATGQTARAAISDDILYDDINSLYGWNNPEMFNHDCRNTQQTAIDSRSVTANAYLFDDCLLNMQPGTALFAYDPGGTKRFDYFDDKLTQLAGIGYHALYARAEISGIDSSREGELADNPNPSQSYYDEIVSWFEDLYHAWFAKDQYSSTRLLLLSFGLVGLIGIRRKFKKN